MSVDDEDPQARRSERRSDRRESRPPSGSDQGSAMHARTWTLAYRYADPVDYGIPPLPDWSVRRTDTGGLALAEYDGADPFVRADDPVRVRR